MNGPGTRGLRGALRRFPRLRAARRTLASALAWARRRLLPSDRFVLVFLLAVVTGCGLLTGVDAAWFPATVLVVPILLAGLALRMPSLVLLYAATGGVLAAERHVHDGAVTPGSLTTVAAVMLVVLFMARMRTRLGVQGTRGESMLFDLRDRLRAQGEVPTLPAEWHTDVVLRPAGGQSFSGDFMVATRGTSRRHLEIALVDVSGKGLDAGTRALMLSGAFGGIIGSLPPDEFLSAANEYLLRQGWEEGFATAVHLVLDLETGEYVLRSAGHPPVGHWIAGTGRWEIAEAEGMLLGVVGGAEYAGWKGRLSPGDALLMFTDGMVELPGQDITVGIDRLLGEAERLVTQGFRDGAVRLVDAAGRNVGDDRAVVLVQRR